MVVGASTTDWIGALSTFGLGVVGFVFTLLQWRASGLRPKFSARTDVKRQAMELTVVNRGRGAGLIQRVVVVRPAKDGSLLAAPSEFDGFRDGKFVPIALSPFASARLIVRAPKGTPFQDKAQLKVEWGAGEEKRFDPLPVNAGIYGLESILPAGSTADWAGSD